MPLELRISGDGSHTLYNSEVGDSYHSHFGAVTESMHVFIRPGLLPLLPAKGHLNILEIGFGTGLNLLLTLRNSVSFRCTLNYHALETRPLEMGIVQKLNYPSGEEKALFSRIHSLEWNKPHLIDGRLNLYKDLGDLRTFHARFGPYHLIYFDAFSPELQPELWTQQVFSRIFAQSAEEAVLMTYSSKGDVKRALQNAGFKVEKLPGPPGKREIIRAIRNNAEYSSEALPDFETGFPK